ncbi:MAG: VWA domain-containing protein [Anaerolineaceae bacterium]|nr:VWA domain-containing protein [Anaerolineae bacterium]MCB9454905.1 VWA domain-containing protein [Anaerolineaceae bacterium]
MTTRNNPYSLLSVAPDASVEEIKTAYRRIARRLHPDANQGNPGAAVQFQDITTAYELLLDPEKRRKLDLELSKNKAGNDFIFTLRVTPSKRAITPLPEVQVMYLLAEILPDPRAKEAEQTRESRLNLTLVLDRSNSMNGTRLDKVKVAAHQIIDQLNAKDILSVIIFNDRAEILIPATPVENKTALKAKISMMNASGGTEIFKGLSAGVDQNKRYLAPKLVNHVVLLTDGNTYGDQEQCITLARSASEQGISISAMGLGQEWNDEFLDELASITGGTSSYINSASAVVRFLNDHVRNLSNAFAERTRLSVASDPDVRLESAFKLSPHPQPLSVGDDYIQLGSLQANRHISVLLQFQMPANMSLGFRSVARLVAEADILANHQQQFQGVSDLSLEIAENPPPEDPPIAILDALGKLTLYRMQERAQEALESGDVREATRRLENLATRLLAMGEEDLAHQAMSEARRVAYTSNLSDQGRKTLKYQTRFLLLEASSEEST